MTDGVATEKGTNVVVFSRWAPGTVGTVGGALVGVEEEYVGGLFIPVSLNIVAVTVIVGVSGQDIT